VQGQESGNCRPAEGGTNFRRLSGLASLTFAADAAKGAFLLVTFLGQARKVTGK